MSKAIIKRVLRQLGIIKLSDDIRYQIIKFRNNKNNQRFKNENPNIPIPPDYILYEAHNLNYESYIEDGLNNAKQLKKHFENHINLEDKKVLDWGCGPARIIRHFPVLLPNSLFYGTDYNRKTIAWNKKNILNASFYENKINPPTSFKNNMFDAIYGLSIFTHLSEVNHVNWINELYRIASIDGVVIVTTHGEVFKQKLIDKDKVRFELNMLVVQGQTLEGHRTFAAYHPPKLMYKMFGKKFKILEHIPGEKESWGFSQDKWILKKIS